MNLKSISKISLNKSFHTLLMLFFLCVSTTTFSQADRHINLPHYDDRPLHYGFFLAGNYSNFRIKPSQYFVDSDSISSVRSVGTTSFTLGFVLNKRLGQFLDARLLPSVAFYNRDVQFAYNTTDEVDHQTYEAAMVEFPLLLKYKSVRRGNNRLYMLAGVKPSLEVGAKKKQKSNNDLRTNSMDLSLELGVGLDSYFELFKFSPEIRFSFGLFDMKNKDNNIYAKSIKDMKSFAVTFAFFFE